MENSESKPVIAHCSNIYLSLTKTWIYSQIIYLKHFTPVIITHKKENFKLFRVDRIYSLDDDKGFIGKFYNQRFRRYVGYYPYFYTMLKKENAVLMHSHFGYHGYEMLYLKRKLKIPMVTTFYGVDLSLVPQRSPEWIKRYKELFEDGEVFLIEGNHMKECLVELGCPAEKTRVQHLGVDPEQIRFAPRKIGNDGKVRILVAGSFREKKGIPYALEAFARLTKMYKNVELTLIGDSGGDPREESEKRKIMKIIDENRLGNSLRILGYQPYSVFLEEIMNHHILLSPSVRSSDGDTEGGAPVSIIEASASGMPVVSTYHCDIPEVLLDGKSGFLVPERDIHALTERLEYLVNHHEIWENMGLAGRRHIEKEYNVVKQVEKLEGIYRGLTV